MTTGSDTASAQKFRAAMLQMCSGIDPAENVRTISGALAEAKAQGADILFTPEMAVLLDRKRDRATPHIVSEADSPHLAALREAAAREGVWLHIGSMPLLADASGEAGGKWVNRSFLIDSDGAIVARYDKIHLFDASLADGESWRESNAYAGGSHPVLAKTPWGNIGLTICYDLRFSALYEALTNKGADLLLVPAAFTRPTGQAHWHVLLRARAIEAGCFVLAPAQCGEHEDGRATYGHSLAVSPWGEVLADMGEAINDVQCVDIDLAAIEATRKQVPALANRVSIAPVEVQP